MVKKDYSGWSKEKLTSRVRELEKRKKYGLVWDSEKEPELVVTECKEKLPVIKEVKSKEIITDKEKSTNILIEGDNYHALSVLNYTHKGKIDFIYIDPPYNTGNEDFKYNDKFVDREDAYRHSKWLSFMARRLQLANVLLKNEGVIFISIDDNELFQLKILCDEIFGEDNFIANLIRRTGATRAMAKYVDIRHDYVLIYSKRKSSLDLKELPNEAAKDYFNFDNDINGSWSTQDYTVRSGGFNYDIPSIDGTEKFNRKWAKKETDTKKLMGDSTGKKSFKEIYELNSIFIKERGWFIVGNFVFKGANKIINSKKYASNVSTLRNHTLYENIGSNKGASKLLSEILGISEDSFNNPKPVELIKYLSYIGSNKNSTILDFFAGSGTTGHAVLDLNKEDGGNRKFILCTNNESKICEDVCYPRIKKVIEGYKNSKGEKVEGLGGNLKYFKTDFVDAEPTDKNKIKLTKEATEMLCLKEDTFEPVIEKARFKIFKNGEKYTGIILDHRGIKDFKKAIKGIKGEFNIYVFSVGDDTFDEEFEDLEQKFKLSPIPEVILRVYRRIFNKL